MLRVIGRILGKGVLWGVRTCTLCREGSQHTVWERMLNKGHSHCFTAQSGSKKREREERGVSAMYRTGTTGVSSHWAQPQTNSLP